MSHLSILPTVFTRLDLLEAALLDEGFQVSHHADLTSFEGDSCPVDLLAERPDQRPLGWRASATGAISMIGDLQRISLQPGLASRLQKLTRRYAVLNAMEALKSSGLQTAQVTVESI
ncbi:MAG: DUF1257 domain-containing protein [Synechococcus sp.]